MQVGSMVSLKMDKVLKKGLELDTKEYFCEVVSYDEESQIVLLATENEILQKVSLDAIYTCSETRSDFVVSCKGIIKERYDSEEGSIIKYYIENGFYRAIVES